MNTHDVGSGRLLSYSGRTWKRAEIAVRCSPFQLTLLMAMQHQSVSLRTIAGQSGLDLHYTDRPLPELVTENELLWLIQVGVLRREVDGQGLTDSFRLTPLGRQLVEHWQAQGTHGFSVPSLWDRLYNIRNRWLRLSV
ncbi:hypothetical protein BST81_17320 [Leptolyngbya sp. 'hensonii']|uniref:Npun_F0494 family protein n=1 Tax=Leptolyngbya sp. 'hensonii' TaxID=1922337 RepID=UPI00094FE609|nr:Npun_F0494 family protein [Leptolyngbya sp. 'hensonii']OLP17116.1 hypothetical protein BST81_17320 [Leptolyngbya sp. 'hensonii']